ncbi:MAG TPA: hypothetical protein PK131_03475 [Candidatus Woesebacteria bacterium]|nr:hypothetical protein [Candidatus Woesebacteria bacterium]
MKLFLNILLILFLPLTIYAIIQNTKGTTVYNVKAERFSPVKESETSDPYFKHIRRALDGYLNGTNDGISLPTFVVNPSTDSNGKMFGLASFNRLYYTSDFTVLKVENAKPYGKIITIFFDKMPDKIFDCWVLKSAKGEYDLRGF